MYRQQPNVVPLHVAQEILDQRDALAFFDLLALLDPPLHHAALDGRLDGLSPLQGRVGDHAALPRDVLTPWRQDRRQAKEHEDDHEDQRDRACGLGRGHWQRDPEGGLVRRRQGRRF